MQGVKREWFAKRQQLPVQIGEFDRQQLAAISLPHKSDPYLILQYFTNSFVGLHRTVCPPPLMLSVDDVPGSHRHAFTTRMPNAGILCVQSQLDSSARCERHVRV
jgi:hypothetical protein